MTPEQKEELKTEIKKQISEAQANIESLKEFIKPISPDNALGRITRAEAIVNQKIHVASLEASESNLQMCEEALKRVETPEFGICIYCKGEINFERIKALPHSTKCIQCAEKLGG